MLQSPSAHFSLPAAGYHVSARVTEWKKCQCFGCPWSRVRLKPVHQIVPVCLDGLGAREPGIQKTGTSN